MKNNLEVTTLRSSTERAYQLIRQEIIDGRRMENSFLPPERTLCDEYGIGRGAVRAILQKLASEQLVQLIAGRGARVMNRVRESELRNVIVICNDALRKQYNEALQILAGISFSVENCGATLELMLPEGPLPMEKLLLRHAAGEYQGIIFAECFDHDELDTLLRHKIPSVVANCENGLAPYFTRVDFRGIGRMAARKLVEQGHKRIAVVCGPLDSFIFHEMLAGFRGALAEEDLYLNRDWIITMITNDLGCRDENLREVLSSEERPTAIFAMRDIRAARIYQLARELNIKIPEDISIISYDNLSWADSESIGLTTVSEPAREMGSAAVDMLRSWLKNNQPPESMILNGELIERHSIVALHK